MYHVDLTGPQVHRFHVCPSPSAAAPLMVFFMTAGRFLRSVPLFLLVIFFVYLWLLGFWGYLNSVGRFCRDIPIDFCCFPCCLPAFLGRFCPWLALHKPWPVVRLGPCLWLFLFFAARWFLLCLVVSDPTCNAWKISAHPLAFEGSDMLQQMLGGPLYFCAPGITRDPVLPLMCWFLWASTRSST